jgi:DNA topoisomerase-1
MRTQGQEIKLTTRKFKAIYNDPVKSAQTVDLVYVSDSQPGIKRVKRGKKFSYVHGNKIVDDEKTLARIRSLVIPPAWENVWICTLGNGHLQATGKDTRKRKQYKYHALWCKLRNQAKFSHLLEFGKALPAIRARVNKDLALPGLPLKKVLAVIVALMEQTSIRVGNNMYEKLYGSFGLTTLKDQHVKINGEKMLFSFKGKKGIAQKVSLRSKRLARIVKQCRDIPGKELFQYYDENGNHKSIDSGMVNHYLKEITGKDFTAKDFRTWSGTIYALKALKEIGPAKNKSAANKNIVAALDRVAEHLGNTRAVCKKYYVHPVVLTLYEEGKLEKYFEKKWPGDEALNEEENIIMKILQG